jgi:hypothetical protein
VEYRRKYTILIILKDETMKIIKREYKVYSFDELSDEGKEQALDKLRHINVEHDWWDSTYDDAKTIGLEISGFDIDRGSYVEGDLTMSMGESIKAIIENHGGSTDTHKLAKEYQARLEEIERATLDDDLGDAIEELEDEYKDRLCEEYLSMLRKEYEYLVSDEAIIDIIEANEYEFTEDGELFN